MWEAGGGGEERKKQAWKERTATMAAAEGPEARMALRCVPAPRRGWRAGGGGPAGTGVGGPGGRGGRSLRGGGAPGGGAAGLSGEAPDCSQDTCKGTILFSN